MKRSLVREGALASALLLAVAAPMRAALVDTPTADGGGSGAVCFRVDPSMDSEHVAEQIRANLQLSEGQLESVLAEPGSVTAKFTGANPGAKVEATLPDATAASIGEAFAIPCKRGAGLAVGGGLAALLAAGGILTGLTAAGTFDGGGGGSIGATGGGTGSATVGGSVTGGTTTGGGTTGGSTTGGGTTGSMSPGL